MEFLILELMNKYPQLASVLMIAAVARAVFKPIMTVIQAYVDATPGESDNAKWEAVKSSSAYKGLAWVIDYLLSIKLPAAKPVEQLNG
jgi:hypothetical protein